MPQNELPQNELTQSDMPRHIENLKRFLIFRLMLVLALVLLVESLVNVLFGQFALPSINSYFGLDLRWDMQPFDNNLVDLLRVALYIILTGLSKGMPFGLSRTIPYLLDKYMMADMQYMSNIHGFRRVLLVMLIFVVVCSYLVPYLVAVLYYSGVVVQKMEEVRAYDRQQREEYTRRRNLLLSDITHDLKTPITTLAGYAQALNEGMITDPEKEKRYLEAIHRKSLEMSELITLLFQYVKMDSEGFALKKERADMAEIVLQIAASAYTDIEESGRELDVDIPEEAIYAQLDIAQFTRAVTNLVNNAIRHTDPGTKIKISITGDASVKFIRVADSGQPIDEALLPSLFEPFVMGDESRNRRGGSGLGLSVTKKVINMHGGEIYVEQPTQEGYTKAFCIKMPVDDGYDY
ncbi:MAG: HAMP domain-containing histidine kinase [Eubacterium sp.]|nr:HAMP domain-containing histidine kinase [Eubacterium sp.]